MEKVLKLYYINGAGNTVEFPDANNQIEIGDFRYDAKRMGGAPSITATVMYPSCLDDVWTDSVFATFNGEKFYLKQTPTSSYSNEDARYKHDLELISERVILDNVYFYDAVVNNVPTDDKPVSNSTKVTFFGNISEFVTRLNASLAYSNVGYTAVVDDAVLGGELEEKLMSFEDQFFSNVLQEIYNTYNLPYYFSGKTIHIGFEDSVIPTTFNYGVDDALMSITKENANYKIVNRATIEGSTENIPFYYPNNSPKGEIAAVPSNDALEVTIIDPEKYADAVEKDGIIDYRHYLLDEVLIDLLETKNPYNSPWKEQPVIFRTKSIDFEHKVACNVHFDVAVKLTPLLGTSIQYGPIYFSMRIYENGGLLRTIAAGSYTSSMSTDVYLHRGWHSVELEVQLQKLTFLESSSALDINYYCSVFSEENTWVYNDKQIKLSDVGLKVVGTPEVGNMIAQQLVKCVNTSDVLLPSIYRATDGKERFYNAVNGGYTTEGYTVNYDDITFPNPYLGNNPKEHIIEASDIKPTIKDSTHNGVRIDKFLDVAFDRDDNNETHESEAGEEGEGKTTYKHSYFFVKLPPMGFNLFDCAIEGQPMTFEMTSGACGACKFTVAVDEETSKNPVQVDSNGNLLRDENGDVICGAEGRQEVVTEFQDRQQDTTNNSVWLALFKEEDTYGIIMPYAPDDTNSAGHRPTTDDTYVITGINLPKQYILNAEKKLEKEIIKYIQENNVEKFKFSISFSRIYFEENPDVLALLNENSRLTITYNNKAYTLYVSSFSYNMSQDEVLPQITVELDEALTVAQNSLQNAISEVKSEVGKALGSIDYLGLTAPYYLRKDVNDDANGIINFKKGIKFGEGGKVEIFDNNSAKLTIDYLEITKKATFTSLEIQERTHVGGQLLVTPAAINCGEVEEFADYYRCYFQTKGENSDEIFNQFALDDQAICQTFNAWGSRYYWRLVVGIGEDYIDLSKTDCDEYSDVPMEGDKIVQFGNRDNEERQNAIVLAAHGEGSPYFIQYQGIDSFEIPEDKIVTKLSPYGNLITGKVKFLAGSSGIENIEGVQDLGGSNLLRNTGFTGDYLSEPLTDEKVLEETSELFSDPLDHWDGSTNVTVADMAESSSGKGVQFGEGGTLTQTCYYNLVRGEKYTVSFRARSLVEVTEGSPNNLTLTCTNVSQQIPIETTWKRYIVNVVADSTNVFTLSGSSVELCDLQLEQGALATAWKPSPLDNSSDRAYWQSMKYLQGAIEESSTVVNGGLVLSTIIGVGEHINEDTGLDETTGGMSGIRNDDNDVAFWAGGSYPQAIETVSKYINNPSYQPTQTELAEMAKFVVTHGGRAILNDIILRGIVYAQGGNIAGFEINESGLEYTHEYDAGSHTVTEVVSITHGGVALSTQGCDTSAQGTREVFIGNPRPATCTLYAMYAKSTAGDNATLFLDQRNVNLGASATNMALKVAATGTNNKENVGIEVASEDVAIRVPQGYVEGFRSKPKYITATTTLTEYDHTVVVGGTSTLVVYLPTAPKDGAEFEIIHTSEKTLNISGNGKNILDLATKTTAGSHSYSTAGVIKLLYVGGMNQWILT